MKRIKEFMAKLREKIHYWRESEEDRQFRELDMRVDQLIAAFDARGELLIKMRDVLRKQQAVAEKAWNQATGSGHRCDAAIAIALIRQSTAAALAEYDRLSD